MSILIQCPFCARSYTVEDKVQGKQVRCQQCGNVFTAQLAPVPPAPAENADSLDPLAVDLSKLPQVPLPSGLATGANPLGPRTNSPFVFSASQRGVSNPSGGPTDVQMRLVSAGMLALGTVVLVCSLALESTQGIVYLGIVILMPLMFVLGIAGLISPNVVRAVGKYGGHLPWQFKAIGWGVMGLSFLLMALLVIGLLLAGFEPDRPGSRNRAPGLTRSQTATVIERIRNSYEASPDREVVRTVSFPVFSMNKSQPEAEAEQTLSAAPGYVPGSIRISADQKSLTFQFRGDKAMANQYVILLPGSTGIFIEFSPRFEE